MNENQATIINILQEIVQLLKRPNADMAWSLFPSLEGAISDLNQHIERMRKGDVSKVDDLRLLFAPTGDLQEISLSSGWEREYLRLASQFDNAIELV